MLEVRDLHVAFVGVPVALDGVDLEVDAGEIVALSGEPGSGKSALARTIAGDLVPSAGTITVDGRRMSARQRNPDRFGISVVRQDLSLCDTLDVAANLMLGRETHL
ncbi:MAG TPA: ATP-binding cassette domain-containing protein, partial [Solirubrobacteraceae bacterium]|nr:ATP-binding cassette domain-containing protein [Solirubrobacteraceae bacterium]